ncbi:MAG: hypothetical protein OEU95_06285 [Nitrospirota bacterium]|nr:hypothetical protein [Nitrospirota bacterium]
MKNLLKKISLLDRSTMVLIAVVLLAMACNIILFILAGDIEKKNVSSSPRIAEMRSLANETLQIKDIVEAKEKKIFAGRSGGVVSTLEQILKDHGLKAQVIKPLDKKKTDGFTEEGAELEIQGADLNSIVNLLYTIENSPAPMKITYADVKTMFEDPDKFILKLTVSLLGKG